MSAKSICRVAFGKRESFTEAMVTYLDTRRYEARVADFRTDPFDDCDLIIPLSLGDQAALRTRPADVAAKAVIPSIAAVRACNDKLAFNRTMVGAGWAANIPPMLDPATPPPFILKGRRGAGGNYCTLVLTQAEQRAVADHLASSEYFAQTYIEGSEEWTTHMLMRDGTCRYEATIAFDMAAARYVKTDARRPRAAQWFKHTPFLGLFKQMLDVVGLRDGACCVNYKIVDGVPLVFEINPRIGGSLPREINSYLDAYAAILELGAVSVADSRLAADTVGLHDIVHVLAANVAVSAATATLAASPYAVTGAIPATAMAEGG